MRLHFVLLLAVLATAAAAQARVSGAVAFRSLAGRSASDANVVIWLAPDAPAAVDSPTAPLPRFRMAQRNKRFEPSLLVIPAGATVDFPNFDPYFHNVFSLGQNHPFDLGLYQAGASRSHRFAEPGVSFVFCNIHPQMTAVILTLPTRWYAISNAAGLYTLPPAPPGAYHVHFWYEHADPAALARLEHALAVPASGNVTLPRATITAVAAPASHLNKYGRPYDTSHGYGPGGV